MDEQENDNALVPLMTATIENIMHDMHRNGRTLMVGLFDREHWPLRPIGTDHRLWCEQKERGI